MTIEVGETEQNEAIPVPSNADISSIEVTISDDTVAEITSQEYNSEDNTYDVVLTGLAEGTATLTATIGELTATSSVAVVITPEPTPDPNP